MTEMGDFNFLTRCFARTALREVYRPSPDGFKLKRAICLAVAMAASMFSGMALAAETQPDYEAEYQKWREAWLLSLRDDFGQLGVYRKANTSLPRKHGRRVVFFGDSITQGWDLAHYFPGKPYINRGISAQTTSQMLLRFRQDVIALRPSAVMILAGANDLNGNTGPISNEAILSNYEAMAEAARMHGIKVIFASMLPAPHTVTAQSRFNMTRHPPERVQALNALLKAYCRRQGLAVADYAQAMQGGDGLIRPELSGDGVHPNKEGYAVMAQLARGAIFKALSPSKARMRKARKQIHGFATGSEGVNFRHHAAANYGRLLRRSD
jgi:lysophospholipase L1-like esterase